MSYRVKRHAVSQPLNGCYRLIPLTQGQNAIVDIEDFEWLSRWNWYAQWNKNGRTFYARRRLLGSSILMHNEIIHPMQGEQPDHKNRNTLDNRKKNLRRCTPSQNQANQRLPVDNTSGYRGVVWDEKRSKWKAQISIRAKTVSLGRFLLREDAARAYDGAARQHFGEFAQLNFPS